MILSLFKRYATIYNKNKRKLLAIALCCSILFCMSFTEISYGYCCKQKKNYSVDKQLFHSRLQINQVLDDDFPIKCSLQRQSRDVCMKLAMGEISEVQKLSRHINHNKTEHQCQLINLVENCSIFKLSHNYVTNMNTIPNDEIEFPLAFAIKMHKSPEQAEQLLRTIYRPHNVYCIYVDLKAEQSVFRIMEKIGNCFGNVFVVQNRIDIVYSSINLIEAELECMRILSKSNTSWKYYINLTGQEFPLKTNFEIVKILQKLNGANDIESYDFPFTYQQRYTKQHIIKNNVIMKTRQSKHSFIKKFQMSKGSAYGTFSRAFVDFILTDNIAVNFLKWLNGSYAPEESAWATLNALPWAPGGLPRDKRQSHASNSFLSRAIIWSWDGIKCRGHFVRGICIFGSGDLPWLISRSELFANKFDIAGDNTVLDCMEHILHERSSENKLEFLNWHFYNTLPHVRYYSKHASVQRSKQFLNRKKEIWLKEHNITSNAF